MASQAARAATAIAITTAKRRMTAFWFALGPGARLHDLSRGKHRSRKISAIPRELTPS